MKKTGKVRGSVRLSSAEWLDVYEALMDAAEVHHSGSRAERILALAKKIREEAM